MTNSNLVPPDPTRTRKLDDLFGDEPFLSPTMKARRLHSSAADTTESSAPAIARSPAADLIPKISDEEATALWKRRVDSAGDADAETEEPVLTRIRTALRPTIRMSAAPVVSIESPPEAMEPRGNRARPDPLPVGPPIPFAQAAAHLRADCPSNAIEGLEAMRQFRNEVLPRWLKKVPARDSDSLEEY